MVQNVQFYPTKAEGDYMMQDTLSYLGCMLRHTAIQKAEP